ncbi:putative transposase [Yersinia pestis PY-66]|uniref:Transposase n=3 Tax=Yersinia pestis TaxID=632 RepID=Q8D1T0_YERPE|nr:putative transposase [Yersinia pestis KIM10+]AAS60358.1 putative transposase [Yersinia pestis biovar Microtus str. 91001]ABG20099.1 transposase [Yersinia pestis Nepal516]ADV97001.1 putative transposase [Yersinia pestis biovar Medievalis str. Harbin 35]EEO82373.1 putative transposase [Yersinia pestis biovar Orientalis str. India 195]EEO86340.1 putative transposase [Yersinia pestis biovar Orientalis str. PEXU2]EEO92645.1 putative transposase [Yersinia pestis Pestoides A]EIQ95535.1 putative 
MIFIDDNIIRTHQHGTGAVSESDESIKKHRGVTRQKLISR